MKIIKIKTRKLLNNLFLLEPLYLKSDLIRFKIFKTTNDVFKTIPVEYKPIIFDLEIKTKDYIENKAKILNVSFKYINENPFISKTVIYVKLKDNFVYKYPYIPLHSYISDIIANEIKDYWNRETPSELFYKEKEEKRIFWI